MAELKWQAGVYMLSGSFPCLHLCVCVCLQHEDTLKLLDQCIPDPGAHPASHCSAAAQLPLDLPDSLTHGLSGAAVQQLLLQKEGLQQHLEEYAGFEQLTQHCTATMLHPYTIDGAQLAGQSHKHSQQQQQQAGGTAGVDILDLVHSWVEQLRCCVPLVKDLASHGSQKNSAPGKLPYCMPLSAVFPRPMPPPGRSLNAPLSPTVRPSMHVHC